MVDQKFINVKIVSGYDQPDFLVKRYLTKIPSRQWLEWKVEEYKETHSGGTAADFTRWLVATYPQVSVMKISEFNLDDEDWNCMFR